MYNIKINQNLVYLKKKTKNDSKKYFFTLTVLIFLETVNS